MAVLVFSGGHTLRVADTAANVAASLSNGMVITSDWELFTSGDARVHVNPRQIAYVVDDDDAAATFPRQNP